MLEVAISALIHTKPCVSPSQPISFSNWKPRSEIAFSKSWKKINATFASSPSTSTSGLQNQTFGGQVSLKSVDKNSGKKRVFFLDVNPLCYVGSTPSLHSFGHWVSLFFSQVSLNDPVIAVVDGERGSEHRRQLLPSYKAHRSKFYRQFSKGHVGRSYQVITDVLRKCNVPVIKIKGHEADDVVATLVGQVLQRGHKVVIASPDKDFKQLLSDDVQIVMPLIELERWSFYTLKHYIAQYNCDPCCDLSLRCILGDEADCVPGIQHVAPGFGRKTAIKLLKKHGTLENLLTAASVRTVGKDYAQNALTKHADYLRRNYEVLSLRRDVDVQLQEEWLIERDTCNDSAILSSFFKYLEETQKLSHQNGHALSNRAKDLVRSLLRIIFK
nr:5'-3' exonuclease isoform X1 [Ziziphus jujuba var. spinosa]